MGSKMKNKRLDKLIILRKNNGYNMKDMADKLNICVSYYCQIELGKRNLYYKMAKEIAKIFNKKPDELFFDDIK